MNNTIQVQKQTLSDIYEALEDIKAKVALLSNTDVKDISEKVSYGLYLVGQNIIDDIQNVQDTVSSLEGSSDE